MLRLVARKVEISRLILKEHRIKVAKLKVVALLKCMIYQWRVACVLMRLLRSSVICYKEVVGRQVVGGAILTSFKGACHEHNIHEILFESVLPGSVLPSRHTVGAIGRLNSEAYSQLLRPHGSLLQRDLTL